MTWISIYDRLPIDGQEIAANIDVWHFNPVEARRQEFFQEAVNGMSTTLRVEIGGGDYVELVSKDLSNADTQKVVFGVARIHIDDETGKPMLYVERNNSHHHMKEIYNGTYVTHWQPKPEGIFQCRMT